MGAVESSMAKMKGQTVNIKKTRKDVLGVSEKYIQFIDKKKRVTEYRYAPDKISEMYDFFARNMPTEFTLCVKDGTIYAIMVGSYLPVFSDKIANGVFGYKVKA